MYILKQGKGLKYQPLPCKICSNLALDHCGKKIEEITWNLLITLF